jgi:uncharacterized protein YecT (DUF1311 family)
VKLIRSLPIVLCLSFVPSANAQKPKSRLPLIIKCKWNSKEFAVASIQKTGFFPTSDDGTKTLTEVENAIRHVDTIANLDVRLNSVYKSRLSKLSAPERETLREEQHKWLAARDKACAVYKGWVGCLSDYCQKHIAELKNALPPLRRKVSHTSCNP